MMKINPKNILALAALGLTGTGLAIALTVPQQVRTVTDRAAQLTMQTGRPHWETQAIGGWGLWLGGAMMLAGGACGIAAIDAREGDRRQNRGDSEVDDRYESVQNQGRSLPVLPVVAGDRPRWQPQPEQPTRQPSPYDSLLLEPLTVFVGSQGSGKTTRSRYLASLHAQQGDRVSVVDPFARKGDYQGVECYGRGGNWADVEAGLREFLSEAKRRIRRRGLEDYEPLEDYHWHLLVDEGSGFANNASPDTLTEFWEVAIQFLRQANMSVTWCTHGLTKKLFGGASADGLIDTIKMQAKTIKCRAKANPNPKNASSKIPITTVQVVEWDGDKYQESRLELPLLQANFENVALTVDSFAETDDDDLLSRFEKAWEMPAYDPDSAVADTEVSEATTDAPEAGKLPNDKNFRDSTTTSETSTNARKLAWKLCKEAIASGKSRTWVVENILEMKGRKFNDGKEILANLEAEFGTFE